MNISCHGHSPFTVWIFAFALVTDGLMLTPPPATAQGQNLFVSDSFANIYQITLAGSISLFASNLDEPYGMAFDRAGNLYEADSGDNIIYKFSSSGTKTTFAAGLDLNVPEDLAFDGSSNLYVANSGGNNLIKITPSGAQSIFATNLSEPDGLAFDGSGYLYVANSLNNTVAKLTPSGVATNFPATGFNFPAQMAFGHDGNLYVANVFGNSISEVTTSGMVTTFASGLNEPIGLAFDSAGNLFDGEDSGINEFTPPSGTPTAFATLPEDSPNYLVFQPASAAPKLTIVHSRTQLIISWPASVTGFSLQTNTTLAKTNWGNYLGPVADNSATISPSQPKLFFRLFQ